MISKDNWLAERLLEHRGHDIAIMVYGSDDTEAHRDCCHECAVEVSRIKNRMFDKVHRW